MRKRIWKLFLVSLFSMALLVGCGNNTDLPVDSTQSPQAQETATPAASSVPSVTPTPDAAESTEASPAPPEASITPTATPEVTEVVQEDKGTYDPNFSVILQAEEAELKGNVRVDSTKQGYTGTGYLTGFEGPEDTVIFTVTVPGSGAYDLNFISVGNVGYKENDVLVDGEVAGVAKVDGDVFTHSIIPRVYLSVGEHKIQIRKSWGWILLDALEITASGEPDISIYNVSAELVDKKATDRTKRLMQYLTDMYGKYIISGQYGNKGFKGNEFTAIYNLTGKYPAILGLDLIEYSPSRVAHGSTSRDVEYAIEFDKEGGIVTFCWHWNAPEKYLIKSSSAPWWKGFYKEGTNIDLKKIMDGEDPEGYDLLVQDIDAIAVQLKRLQDADVPILWRPLHEASGGWFWWGTAGPEAYIKLYRLVFDRLTNYHEIHNLIWVWNGQHQDWYPGDDYVDIVGTDIYPGEKVYSAQTARFDELVAWNGSKKRIVALTENGCLFDPDLAFRDNAIWSYFCTWQGEFVVKNNTRTLSEQYTESHMVKKVYTSDKVITLDELPDLRTYGN